MFLNLVVTAFLLVVSTATASDKPLPERKPITRNFMVTECKKGVCLMKMRPHERRIDKNGNIYWVKIQ